jgi:hypothetical protein
MKARKEITIAIIIGLIVGLVVVVGIIRARSALESVSPTDLNLGKQARSSAEPQNNQGELFLTLETADNQVLSSPTLTIQGSTLAGTYIVILDESEEHIIVPNEVGSFAQDITLVAGANTITVTSYQPDGTKLEKVLTAVYTTAEI